MTHGLKYNNGVSDKVSNEYNMVSDKVSNEYNTVSNEVSK